jgi:hypothetical protein
MYWLGCRLHGAAASENAEIATDIINERKCYAKLRTDHVLGARLYCIPKTLYARQGPNSKYKKQKSTSFKRAACAMRMIVGISLLLTPIITNPQSGHEIVKWQSKRREGKGRQGKRRQGKSREGKGRQGKGKQDKAREGKEATSMQRTRTTASGTSCLRKSDTMRHN